MDKRLAVIMRIKQEFCVFYVLLTVHLNTILVNKQHDALFQCIYLPLYMFRAAQCSSSGDRILLIRHLVCISLCKWLLVMPVRHTKQSLYLAFSVFKIFVLMCTEKTNISSQTDLACKQSLDETQTEITQTENREKHIRLSQSNMRHVVLKAVNMKITVFWNTAYCRLLFTLPSKILFRNLFWRYKL
jgi:hypothetical protein